ncbi:MAG: hypothetical protein ABR915_02350 [Thermoguttaceae bacterium]
MERMQFWAKLKVAAVVAAALPLLLPAACADEIDKLVGEVKPSARFKDYQPKFSIKTVELRAGVQSKRMCGGQLRKLHPDMPVVVTEISKAHLLMDGDRYVGQVGRGGFYWFISSPSQNINDLLEFDNWKSEPPFGVSLPLGPMVKNPFKGFSDDAKKAIIDGDKVSYPDGPSFEPKIENGVVSFAWTDHFPDDDPTEGFSQPQKDVHKVGKFAAKAEHQVTIRVDPVLGYVVADDVKYETNFRRPIDPAIEVEYGSFFPFGNTIPLPKYQNKSSYAWQFYTPAPEKDKCSGHPFGVWRANGVSVDMVRHTSHCFVKGDGLVGFIKNPAGWGLALTKTENPQDHKVSVCPAYGEFYTHGPLPKEPDEDGFYRTRITRRSSGLPPEICDYILKNGKNRFRDEARTLQIRLTGEDFEDQPLSWNTPANGIVYDNSGMPAKLTDKVAHSGKKSLQVKGVLWEKVMTSFTTKEKPPARFQPKARYRVECWIKVEGADTEAFVSLHMIGQTRDPQAINRWRTESVTAGDWKKVSYGVTMPPDGLAIILGFCCAGGGTAWFDDFKIEELGPAIK